MASGAAMAAVPAVAVAAGAGAGAGAALLVLLSKEGLQEGVDQTHRLPHRQGYHRRCLRPGHSNCAKSPHCGHLQSCSCLNDRG